MKPVSCMYRMIRVATQFMSVNNQGGVSVSTKNQKNHSKGKQASVIIFSIYSVDSGIA